MPRLLLFLLPVLLASAEAKTLKVFLVAGQGNALGSTGATASAMRSRAPGLHAAEKPGAVPLYWHNRLDQAMAIGTSGGWTDMGAQGGSEVNWGPEIGFSRLMWDAGYRDFGIVKVANRAHGNSAWIKGGSGGYMVPHLMEATLAAAASLPAGYDDCEIAGILYIEGEGNDATEAAAADTRFSDLLANLKADLPHASSLAAVIGEIGGTGTNRDTTRTRQKALADARADIGYAESTGLVVHNLDGLAVHYDADSQILLGERMAAEMIALDAFGTKPLPAPAQLSSWMLADHGAAFDSTGAVQRWANLADGSAVRDLTRRVAGKLYRQPVGLADGSIREILRFDGTNDLWASSAEFGSLTGARSVAMMAKVTASANGFLFDGSTGSGRTRAQVRSGNWQAGVATSAAAWDSAETTTTARQLSVWQRHVFTFEPIVVSGSNRTRVRHYLNGTEVANVVDTDSTTLGGLIVGSNGGSTFSRLSFDLAEMAVWSKVLDTSEVGALETAWSARWDSPGAVPFSATVSQTPATVARFGRSELLHLAVDCPAAGTTTLQEVRLTLAAGTRDNIAALHLLQTNQGGTSDASTPVLASLAEPASDQVTLTCAVPLAAGRTHFSVVVEPRRYAPLGGVLDAAMNSIVLSGTPSGTVVPSNANPVGGLTLGLVPAFVDLRRSGQDGVHTHRIPGMVTGRDGVLHAVFDIRHDSSADLPADVDVGYMRSSDGGASWTPMRTIMDYDSAVSGSMGNGVGDPCILYDPVTDTLWVAALWSFGNHAYNGSGAGTDPSVSGQYVLAKSTDGGVTWSAPINITAQVKDDVNWRLVFQGPGQGIAMRDGTLVFPSQYRDASGTVRACSVFSSDHGATWDFGSAVPTSSPQTNENTVCELDDGRLLFSMRTPSGSNGQRAWARYTPGGANPMKTGTWQSLFRLAEVPDPVCQGSVVQWMSRLKGQPRELLLFGNPASTSSRVNFTLRVSADGGASWPISKSLYAGSSAYSSISILPDRSIGILFEKDDYSLITFARVEENWLLDPSADADQDGLPDAWELLHGTAPATADANLDPDGDGQSNLHEYLAGTDPVDRASVFRLLSQSVVSGACQLTWSSVPGRSYCVERSSDLAAWTLVPSLSHVTASGTLVTATVPEAGVTGRGFFRVRALR